MVSYMRQFVCVRHATRYSIQTVQKNTARPYDYAKPESRTIFQADPYSRRSVQRRAANFCPFSDSLCAAFCRAL